MHPSLQRDHGYREPINVDEDHETVCVECHTRLFVFMFVFYVAPAVA